MKYGLKPSLVLIRTLIFKETRSWNCFKFEWFKYWIILINIVLNSDALFCNWIVPLSALTVPNNPRLPWITSVSDKFTTRWFSSDPIKLDLNHLKHNIGKTRLLRVNFHFKFDWSILYELKLFLNNPLKKCMLHIWKPSKINFSLIVKFKDYITPRLIVMLVM